MNSIRSATTRTVERTYNASPDHCSRAIRLLLTYKTSAERLPSPGTRDDTEGSTNDHIAKSRIS